MCLGPYYLLAIAGSINSCCLLRQQLAGNPALSLCYHNAKWGGGGDMIKRIPWSDIAYGIGIALFVLFMIK